MSTGALGGVTSMAARGILAALGGAYRARTGVTVAFAAMGGVEAARLVRDGMAVDLVALAAGALEVLEAEGHVVSGSRVDYARSEIAVAVPAGAALPPIGTADDVRRAALAAGRVAVSTGPSGAHVKALCAGWGIDPARVLVAPPGVPVAALLARGESDLGFQQESELAGEPGIALLGRLPTPIQAVTVFGCALAATARDRDAARGFLGFLAGAEAHAAIRSAGMDPA